MDRPGLYTRAGVHRMLEEAPTHPVRRIVRIALALLIVANVVAAIVESIEPIGTAHARAFRAFEVFSVAVFTAEYVLRIWSCVESPRYATRWGRLRFAASPMALVDLLAILPFFLGAAVDARMLRSLRLLRIFKLSRHSSSMDLLLAVIRREASSALSAMSIMVIVIVLAASGIYAIEREAQPEAFDSIPKAMWWAAVTLTTVGYGDVVPHTVAGKIFGLVITLAGVGMVALPAGILASGFSFELQRRREMFRIQLRGAIADGAVSGREQARLERTRDELGLSAEDARLMVETERADSAPGARTCPHCGEPVDG